MFFFGKFSFDFEGVFEFLTISDFSACQYAIITDSDSLSVSLIHYEYDAHYKN